MRWGICSVGRISHDFCNAMKAVSRNNEAVAIASRSLERAQEMAKIFGIPRSYGSYEELSNDPDVDIVYVATVHPEHKAVASLFLNKGKHVLCEKPITRHLKDAQELVSLAREKKLFLMEGFWSRFFPIYSRLRELVDSGIIGAVHTVEATFEMPSGDIHRIKNKDLGGSIMLELGGYTLQFAQWIFRENHDSLQVTGELCESGVDKSGEIKLIYPGGKQALLSFNGEVGTRSGAAVIGEKGRLEIPSRFFGPTDLILPSGETEHHPLPTGCPMKTVCMNSQGLAYEIEHVRECIEKGRTESPVMPLDESLHIMSILEECLTKLGVRFD